MSRTHTITIRITSEELAALQTIAEHIGHGSTSTGVAYQFIKDGIVKSVHGDYLDDEGHKI
jgi:hypothetical protein